jgi:hypothetical protein
MSDHNAGPLGEITIEGELTDYGVEMTRQLLAEAQRPAKTIVLKTPEGEYTLANGQAVAALEAELARVRSERDALQRQIEGRAWDHFDPGFVDVPASEDYPGELASDAPYKTQMRDGRGGWGPW